MDPAILDIIKTGIISLFVAIVASIVTFNLSFNQFRREKKWEKKFEAYSNILNAMFSMLKYDEKIMEEEDTGDKVGSDLKKKLLDLSTEGRMEVERAATLGGFIISKYAAAQIKVMLRDLDATMADYNKTSFFSFLNNRVIIIQYHIDCLNKLADEDLQSSWWKRVFGFMRRKRMRP